MVMPVWAAGATELEERTTATVETEVRASEWGITATDWRRYQELMEGSRGIWSPNADPLMVLGAHAKTQRERDRFAELFVRKEYERVAGELEFQRAIDAAWKRLFPSTPRVQLVKGLSLTDPDAKALRYAVIVEADCTACEGDARRLANQVSTDSSLQPLDIYVRDSRGDDDELRAFVARAGIPVELIRRGRVTINHGEQYTADDVPAVWMLSENGRWSLVQE